MKKFIYLIAITLFFTSCLKEQKPDESFFWSPLTVLERNDSNITLYLIDPRPFTDYDRIPSDPETFEIYYSTDGITFSLYSSIDAGLGGYDLENLVNGQPYYIYVKSLKGSLSPKYSDTLMAISGPPEQPEEQYADLLYNMRNVTLSYDQKYLAGKSDEINGWNLLSADLNSYEVRTVDEVAFHPRWSPVANNIVYISEVLTSYSSYPDQMRLYNAETYEDTVLLAIDFENYFVISPEFNSDGTKIFYLSSEDNDATNIYDIWELNLETYETTRITEYNDNGDFYFQGTLSVDSNDENVYFDVYNVDADQYDIFKYNFTSSEVEPVISSGWRDFDPSVSPDGNKLAFVSTRTGADEIWLYDLSEGTYQQVTGSSSYGFDSRYSYIQWISNEDILVSLYQNKVIKIYKVNVAS